MKKIVLAALLLLAAAVPALAQTQADNPSQYPLISPYRLSLAVRTEYAWWTPADRAPAFHKEWGLGLAASYSLVPKLALTGRTVYFVDSRITQYTLGLNLEIFNGPRLARERGK